MIRKSRLAEPFMRLEPYIFFLFCSHAILFNFAGIIFRRFFGNYGSDLFPITFFMLPVLAVVAAVIGLQVINRSNLLLFLFNAGHRVRPLFQSRKGEGFGLTGSDSPSVAGGQRQCGRVRTGRSTADLVSQGGIRCRYKPDCRSASLRLHSAQLSITQIQE